MMRCIIVDDEPLARQLLKENIRQTGFLQLVGSCKNSREAGQLMHITEVDLIFLDIHLPGQSGLQFLQSLKAPPLAIFVTAHAQYAIKGFELNVVDYLLKPFSYGRFLTACERAAGLLELRGIKTGPARSACDDFFVNVEYSHVKIVVADIDYIEGLKDYIKIHLSSSTKPVITRMTMKSIERKLPSGAFIRTHKSFLAAADKITTIKRDFVCIGEKQIPVSESFKDNINQLLNPAPGIR